MEIKMNDYSSRICQDNLHNEWKDSSSMQWMIECQLVSYDDGTWQITRNFFFFFLISVRIFRCIGSICIHSWSYISSKTLLVRMVSSIIEKNKFNVAFNPPVDLQFPIGYLQLFIYKYRSNIIGNSNLYCSLCSWNNNCSINLVLYLSIVIGIFSSWKINLFYSFKT